MLQTLAHECDWTLGNDMWTRVDWVAHLSEGRLGTHIFLARGAESAAVFERFLERLRARVTQLMNPPRVERVPPSAPLVPTLAVRSATNPTLQDVLVDGTGVAITGAGISRASGIRTFMGEEGLERVLPLRRVEFDAIAHRMLASPDDMAAEIERFHVAFFRATPSASHAALARLEAAERLGVILTSNYDGLHERAGSLRVMELEAATKRIEISCSTAPRWALVVGLSRDEFGTVGLLRDMGTQIISVNPLVPDYHTASDLLVLARADEAVPRIVDELLGAEPERRPLHGASLAALLRRLLASNAASSAVHGADHWARVARNGVRIAAEDQLVDQRVVLLFALLHDCARMTDGHDPGHGERAAMAIESHVSEDIIGALGRDGIDRLRFACSEHANGKRSPCPTVGACWDADRLDLPRVGVTPDPYFLSTPQARRLATASYDTSDVPSVTNILARSTAVA